ncbi:DUF4123 domain-containing protein [Bosea sp. (in: a-proteobacteria)]|uniref:DUF4123 domain-containing protein n=1 Tax=Bosea sp. (in: a-proteobacteria) TaxID=1871050 RepID=UPI003B3ABA3E
MNGPDAFAAALGSLPQDWFAVIDGGPFDDLPLLLASYGLSGRALYLEGGRPEIRDAAGYLVPLLNAEQWQAAQALAAGRPALVVWSWQDGIDALYRHLRTLNLVQIPNEARAEAQARGEEIDPEEYPAYESVLFRHWDPNVLGSLLPLLTPEQQARFFGRAAGVVFEAPDHGGLHRIAKPPALPPPAPGMLRFSAEQMGGLRDQQQSVMAQRVSVYLRDNMPAGIVLTDTELQAFAAQSVQQSTAMGMEAEGAHCRWAYLQLISNGRILEAEGVAELFARRDASVSADERVAMLMRGMIGALRRAD